MRGLLGGLRGLRGQFAGALRGLRQLVGGGLLLIGRLTGGGDVLGILRGLLFPLFGGALRRLGLPLRALRPLRGLMGAIRGFAESLGRLGERAGFLREVRNRFRRLLLSGLGRLRQTFLHRCDRLGQRLLLLLQLARLLRWLTFARAFRRFPGFPGGLGLGCGGRLGRVRLFRLCALARL